MTKNLRRIDPSEHQIQTAIVEWAHTVEISLPPYCGRDRIRIGDVLIKQANEGKRSWTLGKKMKKEGLTAGVSDLFLALNVRSFGGLWIEVKKKNGKLTRKQQDWINLMKIANYCAVVVYSVDEGIQAIKDYLGMK